MKTIKRINILFLTLICINSYAQKVTPVYSGTLRHTTIDMLDSVKNEFSEMLNYVSCCEPENVNLRFMGSVYRLPIDKGVVVTPDSVLFNLSKKIKYTFLCANKQEITIVEYSFLGTSYIIYLSNLEVIWQTKNLEYAKKFADDLVYFQHIKDLASVKNGSTNIANMLKKDSVIRQATALSSVSNESKTAVNVNNANKKEKEEKFFWSLRVIKPIPKWIWATAISGIRTPSNFESEYGKITDWGYGTGVEMHLENGIRLFCDLTTYNYKIEIAENGETVHPALGNAESAGVSTLTLSEGAKYSNNAASLRIGAKYNFLRDKTYQPWIGIAYGMNVWHVKYLTWEENKTYGKANGIQWRPAILAGIDFKTKDMGTYTFFFEGIGTTAEYTMKNLFGLGDYDTHGASAEMGYPSPRIGISCTFGL